MFGLCVRKKFLSVLCLGIVFISADSHAQDMVDILPVAQDGNDVMDGDETHSIVKLTPDKSELIHFEQDIASIIIGNPMHVNVMADSPRTIVVVPRRPGATHFVILGNNGQVLMQRHVVVAAPKKDYVRVKRVCADPENCEETSVFYCPDTCHEIGLDDGAPLQQ